MIIVEVEGEKDGIEKALKKYKRKFERIRMMKQLRNRKEFEKPSVKRRNEIKKATYVEQKFETMSNHGKIGDYKINQINGIQ